MDRFLDEDGNPTSDDSQAATDPATGKPVENGLRDLWVTSTALSTALDTAYFAECVATFAIVMGIAMLLTGIGSSSSPCGCWSPPEPGGSFQPRDADAEVGRRMAERSADVRSR